MFDPSLWCLRGTTGLKWSGTHKREEEPSGINYSIHFSSIYLLLVSDESLTCLQAILIIAIMIITASSVRSLQSKQGLPFPNQVLGWTILGIYLFIYFTLTINLQHLLHPLQVISSVLAFASGGSCHTAFSKFLAYFLGFGPCFVILSISIEGLFYVTYSFVLATWVLVESVVRNGRLPATAVQSERTKVYLFQPDDLRIALFFLFFVQVGFFGTGKWVV